MARSAKELTVRGPGLLIQLAPGQDAIGFPVFGASSFNDLGRKLRAGRGFRPLHSLEVVANKLFVKRSLRTARAVMRGGPEARGIRREGFVDPDQFIIEQAKFKFRVGEDDAARLSIGCGAMVDLQAYSADFVGKVFADERCGLVKGNVLVMAGGGFGCWRENWFWKAIRLAQSRGQLNAADFSRDAIVFPARA